MDSNEVKVVVIKEHPVTKDIFPMGFETVLFKRYSQAELVRKGWTFHETKIVLEDNILRKKSFPVVVEDIVIPTGSPIDVNIKGNNTVLYDGDWFYRNTGRPFSEFFKKL